MFYPRSLALILTFLALQSAGAAPNTTPNAAPVVAPAAVPAQNSDMDGELFYQLLVGEISAQQGDTGAAYGLLLNAAKKTNDARLYQRAVEIALRARAGESALQAAKAWSQAQPASAEANRYVLQILLGLNRLDDAVEPLQKALQLAPPPERPVVIATLPFYFARNNDKAKSAAVLEQALKPQLQPAGKDDNSAATAAAAWSAVGRMRLAADNPEGVLEAAQRGAALAPNAPEPMLLAMALLSPQLPARYAAQRPAADDLLRAYFAPAPQNKNAKAVSASLRLTYARTLLDAQRTAEARAQVELTTQMQPDQPDAWLLRGVLEQQDKQLPQAEKSLKRFLALMAQQQKKEEADEAAASSEDETNEDDDAPPGLTPRQRVEANAITQAHLALSQIAEQRKDYKGAMAWLDKIDTDELINEAGDFSTLLRVQRQRAGLLARQGRLDEGLGLLGSLPILADTATQPERAEAQAREKFYAQVQLLRDDKRYAQAYAMLADATQRNPKDYDLLYDQAMMADKLGRPQEMESLLRRIMTEQPNYPHAWNALGYWLADHGQRLTEAHALIQKAIDLSPGDPFITDSLAWVTFRQGDKAEALKLLRQAYAAKADVEIAAHLGEVLWSLGQQAEAKKVWREGKALSADNETLQETLKRLKVKL